ncbi:hypothetical protein HMPREF0514_10498 [Lactobacillus paragasseri JV-V03]|uniref:dCMP deaminase n=1 Tax=Lactobacillus paragasseri JV-V03 TaxID=525326 RepID=A0AA87AA81_9LACO|nr:hypothetical protein HMPREF0514_10498 [Lactobacillus paragasseri JV-V03]
MLAKLILKINLKLLNSSKIDSDRIESENIYLAGFINEKNRIIFEDNELKKWYDKIDVSKTQKIVEVNS